MGRFSLAPNEVLVWWMDVEVVAPDTETRWRAVLDADERARADRFHREADRQAYEGAHALTRALLSHVAGIEPHAWRFSTGPAGKPEIAASADPGLDFNLSHTSGLVAAAVCTGHAVGIDVEACDRLDTGPDIADHFFVPSEAAVVHDSLPERRRETFFRLWTLKESYLKATGDGLARPLDSFAFTLDPIRVRFHPDVSDAPERWQFFQATPTPRHVLAVALRRSRIEPARIVIREVAQRDTA